MRVAVASWPKRRFEDWWLETRATLPVRISEPASIYRAATPDTPPCSDDTWSPTSTTVPDPRDGTYAVCTGSEMIIWGGTSEEAIGAVGDGGRYSPPTDSWTAVSPIGAPENRSSHTAVWTGTAMLVWGGSGTAIGGLFCSCPVAPPSGPVALHAGTDDGGVVLSWDYLPGAGVYDVIRGSLSVLRSTGGDFGTALDSCLVNDDNLVRLADRVIPVATDGYRYLVRGNSCGGNGTYDDLTPTQVGSRDAGISAFAAACP